MKRTKRRHLNRREFLHKAAGSVAAFTIVPRHVLGAGKTAPSDKLNIACIGVGGRGGSNVNGVKKGKILLHCVTWICDAGAVPLKIIPRPGNTAIFVRCWTRWITRLTR